MALLLLAAAPARGADEVLLATTTSVQDSGLLDALLPAFSEESGIRVRVIAVGSGAALRMGADGNADLLLTHAPAGEQELVRTGAVSSRRPFMENFFVLAGPPEDPAQIASATSAAEALQRIRTSASVWVSRGDDSGTHRREVELWRAAGLDPAGGWPGFASTGSGMGQTLLVAGERAGYTLADLGTFLAFRERTRLAPLVRDDPALRNEYSLLLVNPERHPRVRADAARALERYLQRADTLERIGAFGRDRFGEALFRPLASEPAPAPRAP